jgi:hypothetical protein
LGAESGEARSRNIVRSFVTSVGNDMEQFLDTTAPDRRDDPKLNKMSNAGF